jgi:hypothetical protein
MSHEMKLLIARFLYNYGLEFTVVIILILSVKGYNEIKKNKKNLDENTLFNKQRINLKGWIWTGIGIVALIVKYIMKFW